MILDKITDSVKEKVEALKSENYYDKFLSSTLNLEQRDFEAAFTRGSIGVIAEVKKASPSKGIIVENFNHKRIAEIYEEIKVDAISVLTEEKFFMGSLDYMKDVKKITTRPVLRKDFIVDEVQLYEAKACGADAVLLIAAVLKDELHSYYKLCEKLKIHSLVEVHDEYELENALNCGAKIIGINNRDLKTFNVDIAVTERLMKRIPKDKIVISESGIKTLEDVKRLRDAGVKGLLVGETFMRMLYDTDKMMKFIDEVKAV